MKKTTIKNWLTYFIAFVWVSNGFFCKVLNLVPRHQEIVERILNLENGRMLTLLIGIAETAMAIWILFGFGSRINAVLQMIIIGVMNILEYLLASDLLLWGKMNSVFAFLFILLIWYKEFYLTMKHQQTVC